MDDFDATSEVGFCVEHPEKRRLRESREARELFSAEGVFMV